MDHSPSSQRAILLPTFLIWLIAILAGVHIFRQYFLSPPADFLLLFRYGVTPRDFGFTTDTSQITGLPHASWLVNITSLFTHMFLHADLTHLLFNSVWLAAFGTPVVRRLGALGFSAIFIFGGLGGALLYIYVNPNSYLPMIGASGAVSALIGAAMRFAFRPNRPTGYSADPQPVLSLTNKNVLMFTAVWFITNWLFGATNIANSLTGGQSIAWEAHIGGFITGVLIFPIIDRIMRARAD